MSCPQIAYILPSYRCFEYARACLESLLATTPRCDVIVVDDASPDWRTDWYIKPMAKAQKGQQHVVHRFDKNGGLNRSWNQGLRMAQDLGAEYAVVGNNDVLLSPNWWRPLVNACNKGFAPAGPISNAAGVTAKGKQDVRRYIPNYKLSDDLKQIAGTAKFLQQRYGDRAIEVPAVNGFFMMARTDTWFEHAFDKKTRTVFRPLNKRDSKGRPNPTPTMTLNEDELQARWTRAGLKPVICMGSFIFHYRSVARGVRYAKGKGQWMRRK